jgi:hypothetical protein
MTSRQNGRSADRRDPRAGTPQPEPPRQRQGDLLSDEELDTLSVLRRVGDPDGWVTEVDGRYFSCGQPMVPWLERPLAALLAAGLITLAEPHPAGYGTRRATVTEAGYARYHALRVRLQDSGWPLQLPGPGQR